MNWEDRASKAVQYLADTDEPAAKARARFEGLKAAEKTVLGAALLDIREGTVPEKEAQARNHPTYAQWREDYENAAADWFILQNRRDTAHTVFNMFQTLSANKRQGMV